MVLIVFYSKSSDKSRKYYPHSKPLSKKSALNCDNKTNTPLKYSINNGSIQNLSAKY